MLEISISRTDSLSRFNAPVEVLEFIQHLYELVNRIQKVKLIEIVLEEDMEKFMRLNRLFSKQILLARPLSMWPIGIGS